MYIEKKAKAWRVGFRDRWGKCSHSPRFPNCESALAWARSFKTELAKEKFMPITPC